jgi:hypothetical protein
MRTYKWLAIDDTHLLMQLQTRGERQEWHPIAQVTLRQIYAEVAPMHYAWWQLPGLEQVEIGKWVALEEAIARTEEAVKGIWPRAD